MDATDSASVSQAVQETVSQLGRLDIVVANAGGLLGRVPLAEMSDDHWREVVDVNLSSAFYLVRASLPVPDPASWPDHPDHVHGCPYWRVGRCRRLRRGQSGNDRADQGPGQGSRARGITVNAIAPGLILGTPFHEQFTPPADQEKAIARIPLGRAGRPGDVASLVTYLASESSSFLTGEVIQLSGGQQLT